jgi:hypothetical protein
MAVTFWNANGLIQLYGDLTKVTATIIVPTAKVPLGGFDEYGAAVWVGINSNSRACGQATVQAGLTTLVGVGTNATYYGGCCRISE